MVIVPAVPDDLDTLIDFRDEAARWLTSRGIDQWSSPWPSEDLMIEGILRNIEAQETFIVWDGTAAAATITVDGWANTDLWNEAERAEPALYAHKLTVARAYAGCVLGIELLDWAGTYAADSGAAWLRVDVWTTNHKLQRYYLDHGFTHIRTVVLPHNPSGALFQRPARRVPTPRLHEASTPSPAEVTSVPPQRLARGRLGLPQAGNCDGSGPAMSLAFLNVDVSPEDPVELWPTEAVLTALERGGLGALAATHRSDQ